MKDRILLKSSLDQFLLKDSFPINGKKVLVRVDFNVPILNNKVVNDFRIRKTLKTLRFLLERNCRVVLLSHLGRPKSENDRILFTLKPVWKHLHNYLKVPLFFCDSQDQNEIKKNVDSLEKGSLLLLENTRFYNLNDQNKENLNDRQLSKFFASLGEYFVYEAFATSHRKHASTYGVLDYFDSSKVIIGFLAYDEINLFYKYLSKPSKPFHLIMGGGKPESKLPLIGKLLNEVDKIIVCGALSYTFLKAKGYQVGNNPVDNSSLKKVKQWIKIYDQKIILPLDFATNKKFENTKPIIKNLQELEKDDMCLDSGPKSNLLFQKTLQNAKTIVWNGPPGIFEWSNYQNGTKSILNTLKKSIDYCQTIVGGGDSSASSFQFGYHEQQFSHVSTGGGAFLLLLQTNNLPVFFKIINLKKN